MVTIKGPITIGKNAEDRDKERLKDSIGLFKKVEKIEKPKKVSKKSKKKIVKKIKKRGE